MVWILDCAVIIILILTALVGYKKGFVKYIISSIGTITAIIIAFLVADMIAPTVYDQWVRSHVRDYVEEKIERFDVTDVVAQEMKKCGYDVEISDNELANALRSDGDISAKIGELAEKKGESSSLAKELKSDMEKFFETRFHGTFNRFFSGIDTQKLGNGIQNTKNQAYDIVRSLAADDKQLGAKYIEDKIVRPFGLVIVKIILTIVLFVLLSIVVKILLNITNVFYHIPLVNGVNRFFGFIAGLAKGGLYLLIIAFAIALIIESCGDSFDMINTKIIDKTYLFRHLFYLFYDI
ncbi:MAG: CvpA family protein [Ruminococcus sp.]|nr:CvpA family protein [Ruminococcus sp.]